MATGAIFAGAELGGTKSVAVLARGHEIIERHVVPTTTPMETLGALSDRVRDWMRRHAIAGLGIASFGPLRVETGAPDFGTMLPTPKPGWTGAPVAALLTQGLACPWRLDTDVNAAALAEFMWGAGQGQSSVCYITIGTGVGGGVVIDGRPVHGAMHPEIGHLRLRRAEGDSFAGACPFHRDCIEGLISGPALKLRLGAEPADVPADDRRWADVAWDLAELTSAVLLTTSAARVLIGGGVGMARRSLLPLVRSLALERLGGYLPFFDAATADKIVRTPALGSDAGPLGAIALAHAAAGSDPANI